MIIPDPAPMDGQDSARRRPAGRIPRPNAPCPGRRRPGGCLPHPFLDTPAGPRFDRSSPLFGVLCLSLGASACWRSPGRLHRPSARRPRSGPDSNSPSRCPSRCPTCAPNRPSSCASGAPPLALPLARRQMRLGGLDPPLGCPLRLPGVPLAAEWPAHRTASAGPLPPRRETPGDGPLTRSCRARPRNSSGAPWGCTRRGAGGFRSP